MSRRSTPRGGSPPAWVPGLAGVGASTPNRLQLVLQAGVERTASKKTQTGAALQPTQPTSMTADEAQELRRQAELLRNFIMAGAVGEAVRMIKENRLNLVSSTSPPVICFAHNRNGMQDGEGQPRPMSEVTAILDAMAEVDAATNDDLERVGGLMTKVKFVPPVQNVSVGLNLVTAPIGGPGVYNPVRSVWNPFHMSSPEILAYSWKVGLFKGPLMKRGDPVTFDLGFKRVEGLDLLMILLMSYAAAADASPVMRGFGPSKSLKARVVKPDEVLEADGLIPWIKALMDKGARAPDFMPWIQWMLSTGRFRQQDIYYFVIPRYGEHPRKGGPYGPAPNPKVAKEEALTQEAFGKSILPRLENILAPYT